MVQRGATGRRGTANRVLFETNGELRKTERVNTSLTDDGRLTPAVTATYSSYPTMHEAVRADLLAINVYGY
jgi:hypothetical protein